MGRIDRSPRWQCQRALIDTIELSNAVRKAMEMTSDVDTPDRGFGLTTATPSPSRAIHTVAMTSLAWSRKCLLWTATASGSKADDGKPYTTLVIKTVLA